MPKQTILFEAKNISKDFPLADGQVLHVLKDIDVVVHPDEVVALIGPSGCGKSTLLRICAGLIPQTKGKISYHGHKLRGLLPSTSMVFQSFGLYPWMTVKQNIEIVLKAARFSVADMEKKTQDAIELIGLSGFEDAYPRELSGGMKQRVGMARALVRNPELLFMDEPFSEVDAFTAEVLRAEVIRIWSKKELGLSSILLVSHDVHEVAYMADRIIVLGMHPSTVRAVIENPLPRPRDYRSPEFLKLVEELHDTYGKIQPKTEKRKAIKEKIGPLLPVHNDEILGLLHYLKIHQGVQDIFKIGAESRLHFDKVTLVLEAAELLDFVEIQHRKVILTKMGKEFLEGSEEGRREIWKHQLVTIPLFIKIRDMLKDAYNHTLSHEELLLFLRRELPHQDIHSQLSVLIRWGNYGRLFNYHKIGKNITLIK